MEPSLETPAKQPNSVLDLPSYSAADLCPCRRSDCALVRSDSEFLLWRDQVLSELPLLEIYPEIGPLSRLYDGWRTCRDPLGGEQSQRALVADSGVETVARGTLVSLSTKRRAGAAFVYALESELSSIEEAYVRLAVTVGIAIPPFALGWAKTHWRTHCRRELPPLLERGIDGASCVSEILGDPNKVAALGWLLVERRGDFELLRLRLLDAHASRDAVAALERAALATYRRLIVGTGPHTSTATVTTNIVTNTADRARALAQSVAPAQAHGGRRVQGSQTTLRDRGARYWVSRLKRDFPAIAGELAAGKYRSVAQARRAAGLGSRRER